MPQSIRIETSLASQLTRLRSAVPQEIRGAVEKDWQKIGKRMGQALVKHVARDVWQKQANPDGKPWMRLAPASKAIRRKAGVGSSKLGYTRSKALMNSFKIGKPGNVFRVTRTVLTYGSSLRRRGHVVATGFSARFVVPYKGGDEEVEAKRRRVRLWMLRTIGRAIPGKGRVLAHPGDGKRQTPGPAREILPGEMPPRWSRSMLDVFVDGHDKAVQRAMRVAVRRIRQGR